MTFGDVYEKIKSKLSKPETYKFKNPKGGLFNFEQRVWDYVRDGE